MRTLIILGTLALSTATAAADHGYRYSLRYAPQNQQPQTEQRYQPRNKLADVRLDAFGGRSYVQLGPSGASIDYLELRAGCEPVALRDVTVQLADGSTIHTGSRGIVEPYEGRVIDLPPNAAPVVAVIPAYDLLGRTGGSLELFGVREHRGWGYHY